MVVGPMLLSQKQWAKLEEVGAVLEFAWRGTLDHSVFPGSLRGFKVQGFEGTKGFSRHETCFIQSRKERRKEKTCVRGAFVDN
jgi:hypothetical protein